MIQLDSELTTHISMRIEFESSTVVLSFESLANIPFRGLDRDNG